MDKLTRSLVNTLIWILGLMAIGHYVITSLIDPVTRLSVMVL